MHGSWRWVMAEAWELHAEALQRQTDQFAAAALTGQLLSSFPTSLTPEEQAEWAYRHAAAMMAERAKRDERGVLLEASCP
jgi:hypothetical protein